MTKSIFFTGSDYLVAVFFCLFALEYANDSNDQIVFFTLSSLLQAHNTRCVQNICVLPPPFLPPPRTLSGHFGYLLL